MRQQCFIVSVLVIAAGGSLAKAASIIPGCDPADRSRIIWADPFDYYAQWNYDNRAAGNNTWMQWDSGTNSFNNDLTAPFPIGSPSGSLPGKLACSSTTPGNAVQTTPAPYEMARAQWVQTMNCSGIVTPGNPSVTTSSLAFETGFDSCSGNWVETSPQFGRLPYTWGTGGSYDAMTMYQHSFKGRIQAIDPTKNAVQGTNEKPLLLQFDLREAAGLGMLKNNAYVELSLDGDHAPTDYIWRGDNTKTYPDPDGCPQGPYPIVCQQVREINSSGSEDGSDLTYLNANCPPLSPNIWNSFAFGFLAIMDKDPCGILEQGGDPHIPNVDHFAYFDGNAWRQLRANRGLGEEPKLTGLAAGYAFCNPSSLQQNTAVGCGSFSYGDGGNTRVIMKIMTDYVLVYARVNINKPGATDYTAAIPRAYKGPFNMISIGVAPGCELDPTTGECKAGGTPKQCMTYASQTGNGYNRTVVDALSVLDGELVYVTNEGACCYPSGVCVVQDQLACEAEGGTFNGQNTTCGQFTCCPHDPFVWADRDADGDVDADDFGGFQICYSGPGGGVSGTCKCFNRDNDNDVDVDDLTAFTNCVTGANVPVDVQNPPPGCVP